MLTMYDSYIVKRTQIYLDEDQAKELTRRSRNRGSTTSHLIREAIEQYLAGPDDASMELARQRALLREAFGVLPQLPDGRTFVEEARLDEGTRAEELESRWRSR
jgi:predicted DNA-binding protein